MKKRTLAWLLTLVLVISLVPMAAMALTCPHASQSCTSNNDGTHTWTCNAATCDDPVRTESCDYDEDGACKFCGYNPNEQVPDEPDGEPKPKPSSGLDKVPKTGDNGTGIVITSLTVLALFAAAFHICDKKRAI